MRESIGNVVFFTTYEISRYHLLSAVGRILDKPFNAVPVSGELATLANKRTYSRILFEAGVDIFSGGLAGMMFWSAVLPLDVAKTRIQTSVDLKSSTNTLRNTQLIYRELGFRGLYAGLGPTLTRAFPANAAAMVTWELTAKILGVRHYEK
eukprot:c4724_g1_i2 orf=782-1234(+)